MSHQTDPDGQSDQPMIYHIRIKGHLGHQWTGRFGELRVTPDDDGTTLLIGRVVDQAALYGILRKIRDLGMVLLAVNFVGFSAPDAPADL